MAWRVARSLLVFHAQLQEQCPQAKPPATDPNSWGTIGDPAHNPDSDHSPHDFIGWGNDIVTAADWPHAPNLGLDANVVTEAIRLSRDKRTKYVIFNRRMFSSYYFGIYPPFTWRNYTGTDPHTTHGHLSVVGDVTADGIQPWVTGYGGVRKMGFTDDVDAAAMAWRIDAFRKLLENVDGGPVEGEEVKLATVLYAIQAAGVTANSKLDALAAAVAALGAPNAGLPFTDAQLAQIRNVIESAEDS